MDSVAGLEAVTVRIASSSVKTSKILSLAQMII